MAENNLTTTARAVTRSAFGINIKDPEDSTKTVVRKPDESGIVDLSKISFGSKTKSYSIGDRLDKPTVEMTEFILHKKHSFDVDLDNVKSDFSNIPNGIDVTFGDFPVPIFKSGKIFPSSITFSNAISKVKNIVKPDNKDFPNLTNKGLSFTKEQLINISKSELPSAVYDFDFGISGGDAMYIDSSTPDMQFMPIKKARMDLNLKITDEVVSLNSLMQIVSTDVSAGIAYIPINSVIAN